MIDREKVIKALEKCKRCNCDDCTEEHASHCPWDCIAYDELVSLALSLLKEQDAVEPIKMQRMDGNFSFFVPYYLCGNCRYELVGKDVMFCSHCGRSVKWE